MKNRALSKIVISLLIACGLVIPTYASDMVAEPERKPAPEIVEIADDDGEGVVCDIIGGEDEEILESPINSDLLDLPETTESEGTEQKGSPEAVSTEESYHTDVVYEANCDEKYSITVPAVLAPGESGSVELSGTWASDKVVTVTADANVILTNSISKSDTKDLDVDFDGITLSGNNTQAVSASNNISVEDISNALFGTWSGTFYYHVTTSEGFGNTNVASEQRTGEAISEGSYSGETFVNCTISGGWFSGCSFEGCSISGGLFNNTPSEECIAVGYEVQANVDPFTKDNYPYAVSMKAFSPVEENIEDGEIKI